jgi:Ca-activated chloride channel homolog
MLPLAATSKTILTIVDAVILRSCGQAFLGAACMLLAIAAPTHLRAQEPQQPPAADEVVKVSTDLFVIPIRVRDKREAATTLTERDLTLKDEDHVTAGLSLYHGADRVALVFALDQSGSLREIVSQQREAALALAGRFGDKSQVAVIRFGEQPSLVVPFGRNISAARDAFSFPARVDQHTAIFDAAAAVSAFEGLPQVRSERRIVVLISDGLDNASTVKARSVIEAAMRNHVSFYVIHLPLFEPRDGRLAVRSPAKGFRELAEKTDGKYFLVGDARTALATGANKRNIDLTPIFQAIEDDLRSQYLLGFYAGEGARDSRSHRFEIGFPAGVEYQLYGFKYSRTHEFFHGAPGKPTKASK